jgi:translocation and assembly module TamB
MKIKSRKAKIATSLCIAVLSIGILFFLLRGPYLSNSIKRIIIPVLENATRERIIIDRAVINLFPFYLQAKGFKLFDKDGNRLLWITKTRVYIDLIGLFSKEIRIRKLVLKEPDLTANESDIKRIIGNLNRSSSVSGGGYRLSLKNIKLTDGNIKYSDAKETVTISGSGLYLDMTSKNTTSTINVLLKSGILKLPNQSEIDGGISGKIKIEGDQVKIVTLNIHSSESSLKVKGRFTLLPGVKIGKGRLSGTARIYADTINEIFGLKQRREGLLSVKGIVNLTPARDSRWPEFTLNLSTKSNFYLETLMEILEIKKNIKGRLSVRGKIRGTFPEIVGKGTITLKDAVIDRLPLDDVNGEIFYKDKRIAFKGLTARAFEGQLKGNAQILIPTGDYSVNASVSDISSPQFFQFIKWEPPFPAGKIRGHFKLSHKIGDEIEVDADVNYKNTSSGQEGDVLNRLQSVHTLLELKNNVIRLQDTVLSTSLSDLNLNGNINLEQKALALNMELETRNISDLTAPYYTGFIAPVRFRGGIKGTFDNPRISGRLEVDSGSIQDIYFTNAFADFSYSINLLHIERLRINQDISSYDISGSIEFRGAEKLFSFKAPLYKIKALLNNINIEPYITAFYKKMPLKGIVSGRVSFEGSPDDLKGTGELSVSKGSIYGQEIDQIDVKYSLYPEKIEFHSIKANKGESYISAEGALFFDRRFNLSISSNKVQLCDFPLFDTYPLDAVFGLDVRGSGTIDNPDLRISLNINKSFFKDTDVQLGKGEITGRLKGKNLEAKGSLMDGLVFFNANATFSKKLVWNAALEFKNGRYDFLVSGFLKDVPQDLTVFLKGIVNLKGHGKKVTVNSRFESVSLTLYGYDLRNTKDIVLDFIDNKFLIKSFSLSGNDMDLIATGTVKIKDSYKLTLKGNINITPLKLLTDKLASLRGEGKFTINIAGSWRSPEIVGEINVTDAIAGLKDFPYKIGPVNGTFYFRKDKIVFKSVNVKFAGGSVVLSGSGLIEHLSLKRLSVSSVISGVRIRPVEDVRVALDGRLFYEFSSKGSSLTGSIDIKKAGYMKRIEWKRWLLGLKEIRNERGEYPPLLANTTLNIHISGRDNIIVDNNIARTSVEIDLNLTGTIAKKGLLGRIKAKEGSIYFRSNEFKLLEGSSVDFMEPNSITPIFHILAEAYISDYYVRLALDGSMEKFTLSLFSDPPLPEPDILTLLTVGQITKGSKGIDSGIAAGEAAAILTGGIQDSVEKQLKDITGFERFEIEPHTTTEGAFVPKVTIGKRLFEDKLFVVYSTSIGTTEESVIKLEYRLNKNFSIVGSRNEIGSTGVDLKYRFEFK